jgi:putative ABC transport system permease protein
MILLRLLSWQYARKHKLRTFLTTVGIILGTAVFVGMHTANQSVLAAFHQTVNRIAGGTQLQVTAGDTGFDESVLEGVQAVPEVNIAVPVIEASANTELAGQGSLLILGVDMTGDQTLRDYAMVADEAMVDDPLVFLAQPDSIIVADTFAKRNSLDIGSKLAMRTMEGEKQFTIRGIMKSGGLASAFGGNLAVMDIYAAQKAFGRGRRFDRIDITVKEGVSVEDAQRKLESVLGPGFQVESPSARGAQFESLSQLYSVSADLTSAFALFIGLFIIFNTFSIAVAQRRREIGVLRMLGSTRGQIRALYFGESILIGILGSCAGIGLGLLIARAMASFIGAYLGEVYGVAQRTEEIVANPALLFLALAIGVATSLIAAIVPARNAARVDPVRALHKGQAEMISEAENRTRRSVALVLLALSLAAIAVRPAPIVVYASFGLTIAAALLLAPSFSLLFTKLLRPLLGAVFPVEGILAADSVTQSPRRTSGALSALMLSLALVIALGGLARASFHSITDWLDVAFNPDLFVATSEQITSRSFRFPAAMRDDLASIPGIAEVQSVRTPRVLVHGTSVMIIAIDAESAGRRAPLPAVAGRNDEMYKAAAAGKGIIASENFVLLQHVNLGDILDIPSPDGVLRLPVVGIILDFSDQKGSLFMDRSLYIQHWHDDSVNVFRLYLDKGADPATVKTAILTKLGDRTRLFVIQNRELRAYILNIANQWFGIAYLQIAVAVLVAILGIVNTLTVSISDRRRELGIVQAIGGLRAQVRRMIWVEAVLIGAIGLALGLLLGAAALFYVREIGGRDIAGVRLAYEYPFGIVALLIPAILGSALLSALGPAEAAVRGRLVEALEYE